MIARILLVFLTTALMTFGIVSLPRAQWTGVMNPAIMNSAVLTLIPGATGTVITDGNSWATITAGGATGAFSAGNLTNQTEANSSACNSHGACAAGTRYLGKQWSSPRIIRQLDLYGPNNNSLLYGGGTSGAVSFDGSNDATCSASWTSLDSFATSGANSQHITRTSTITVSTAYTCHRLSTTQSGAVGSAIAAFQMYDLE